MYFLVIFSTLLKMLFHSKVGENASGSRIKEIVRGMFSSRITKILMSIKECQVELCPTSSLSHLVLSKIMISLFL